MKRLAYIDWMRGLACLLMFQTHCYDSWLRPELHDTQLYKLSQLAGTLPAPLFIFLAGVSFALVTEKLREKGIARSEIARQTIWRGAEIFGLGLLFRIQEYALGHKWVPWTDLLRVDILNILGISMMLMGVLCWCTAAPVVSTGAPAWRHLGIIGRRNHCATHSAVVDKLAAEISAMAVGNVHQWFAYLPSTAALAFSDLSLVCIRVRRLGRGLFGIQRICA